MQDDYLHTPTALENTLKVFNENDVNWVITGCVYGGKDGLVMGDMFPKYTENILTGNNRIGSPSVLTIKNEETILFNKDLIWLMDCDFYKRLYIRYNMPIFTKKINVVNRLWGNRLSDTIPEEIKNKELSIMKDKYK
jgi:hypothetical protein